MQWRGDIDGLRGIAVLAVVIYHLTPELLPGGFAGVDVFFVISGYLITTLTLRRIAAGTLTLAGFYAGRAQRLLPALLVVLLACVLAGEAVYGPGGLHHLGQAALASALFVANLHFYRDVDYFAAPADQQPLLHLWSLGVEEQFYLLAPLLLLGLARRRVALGWSVGLGTLASLGCAIGLSLTDPSAAFYLLPARAWELGLGMLLALVPEAQRPRWAAAGGPGLAFVLLGLLVLRHGALFPAPAALLPCGGALLVLAGDPARWAGRLLAWGPLALLGRLSYALYLWHWPVISFASFWWMRPPEGLEVPLLGGVSLGLALLTHLLVEAPIRHVRRAPRQVLGMAAGATAAMVVLAASLRSGEPMTPSAEEIPLEVQLAAPTLSCADLPEGRAGLRVCRFGAAEAPLELLVWGDSHAATLAGVLADLGEQAGRSGLVVAKNDCPPIPGVTRADLPMQHQCAAHNQAIRALIDARHPTTVVLSARWPLVFDGTRYGDDRRPPPRYVQAGSLARPVDPAQRLTDTVDWLRAEGAEVLLIDTIPEVAWDVSAGLEAAARRGLPPPAGPTRAEVAARGARSTTILAALAQQPGVSVVRPAEALCDAQQCDVVEAGEPLYYDDNHLTPRGVERLRPLLARSLGDIPP